jgi:hypothetical protein
MTVHQASIFAIHHHLHNVLIIQPSKMTFQSYQVEIVLLSKKATKDLSMNGQKKFAHLPHMNKLAFAISCHTQTFLIGIIISSFDCQKRRSICFKMFLN